MKVVLLLALASVLSWCVAGHKIPLIRKSNHHLKPFTASKQNKRTINSNTLFSDYSIIAPISIGTPFQDLYVLLDTSSSDLAIFTSDYISQYTPISTSSQSSSTLGTAYTSSLSSSFQSTDQSFQNNYGSGSTTSYFVASTGKETISVEGLTLINQPFALITQGNVSYGPMASGILGLAFEAASTGLKSTPPIQQLYLDGALASPLFSFALMRPSTESELLTDSDITQPGGIFTLGTLDTDQYQGEIGWSSLVSSDTQPVVPTKWMASLDNITINGVLVEGSLGMVANFDTGSSASRVSSSTLNLLFSSVADSLMSSEGNYYLPCGDGTAPAMNMTISMGGVSVEIEPLDLLYKTQAYSNVNDNVYCQSTLSTTTSTQYDLQVGDDILRSLFVAFQYDPPRVGLAAQSTNVHNQGAKPSYAFGDTSQTIAIDTPTSPSDSSASISHVSVATVASSVTAHVALVTEAGQVYTLESGGSYVRSLTDKMQTIVASSTPVPIGPTFSTSTLPSSTTAKNGGGVTDSKQSSSASFPLPTSLSLFFLVSLVSTTLLFASM